MIDRIDDLLDGDEETTPDQPDTSKTNAAFAQQRKELAALKKEAEELRSYRADRERADKTASTAEVFKGLGLNPKHAEFFTGEEATEDAVRAWAVEKELLTPSEDEPEAAPAPETRAYVPTVISEGQVLGSKVWAFDDWMKLSQTDPAQANALWKAGRVADAVRS